MAQKSEPLNKSEVGTTVPTSDGSHPRQNSNQRHNPSQRQDLDQVHKPRLDYHISPIWPILWSILMLINIIFGLLAPKHDLLILFRVGSIVLCLIYAARTFPKDFLLILAMFTTCISDIILALNNISELGLIVFFTTQIIHLLRLAGAQYKNPILAFAGLAGVLIILDLIFALIPLLFLVVGLYAVAITLNVLAACRWHRDAPMNLRALFALFGFILFACCDLMTCVSYLSFTAVLPAFLYIPANFFAWFFYYPSQVLISNSGKLPKPHEVYP